MVEKFSADEMSKLDKMKCELNIKNEFTKDMEEMEARFNKMKRDVDIFSKKLNGYLENRVISSDISMVVNDGFSTNIVELELSHIDNNSAIDILVKDTADNLERMSLEDAHSLSITMSELMLTQQHQTIVNNYNDFNFNTLF